MSITRAQPEPAGTPSTEESVLKGMRLLIVDDLAFNVALMRGLLREAEHRGDVLDEAVRARTVELEQARLESLTILASVTEYHDDDTHRHTRRVGATAALLARGSGCPSRSSPACAPPLRCTTSARSGSRTRSCSSRVR